MVYITGDTHGDYMHIEEFCTKHNTNKDDILIVLGDTGLNFYLNKRDSILKEFIQTLPITLFCIRGNHEERPSNIESYTLKDFGGSKVYAEEKYPNIMFAMDGSIYNIDGHKCLCIGGAYSVDKYYRLLRHWTWFESEQLTDTEKNDIESKLCEDGKCCVDYVLSHTCPYNTRPTHLFLSGIDQSKVDTSMEQWMQHLVDENIITFDKWYFGHYHGNWINDKYHMLYTDIIELH